MEKQLETVMKENQALREVQKGQLTKSKSVYLFIYDIYTPSTAAASVVPCH